MGLHAQTANSSILISTLPVGARFLVDGTEYTTSATFVWPTGSTHIVVFITDPVLAGQTPVVCQTVPQGDTKYCLQGWVDNGSNLQPKADPVQVVTADPSITSLTANVTVAYRAMLNFFNTPSNLSPDCGGAPGTIPAGQFRPGIVYLSSSCFWSSANVFLPASSMVQLNAFPYPGFVFTGWTNSTSSTSAYLTSIVMTNPVILEPHFSPARRVTFLTSPLQLEVMVDHTTVTTRADPSKCDAREPLNPLTGFPPLCYGDFDFGPNSSHLINGISPQRDKVGNWWVFDHFSDGLPQNGTYTVDSNVSKADTVTAVFVRGAQVALMTSPNGLQLNVDGRSNWPSYNFVWGQNSSHQVSATATQFDGNGRQYTFQGWSNSGGASQTIVVDQNTVNNGMRLTANYSVLSRVVVQSVPSGMTLQVDGAACVTPCNVDRKSGTQLRITAPTTVMSGPTTRLDFTSWTDGGASDHSFTINQDTTTVTATYKTSYQLSTASNPANGVTFHFSPSSSDMFYPQNTKVTVNATANPGFKFRRWDGALSGTYPSGVVTMSSPQGVIAEMDTVPYIAPAGVQNAAGTTPNENVASGSVIAIYGQSLAPSLKLGPVNPLEQSLEGVTVTVDSWILPLLFVSQGQINAQLPYELPAGKYTIDVHSLGQPDVTGTFTVVRNAPGLFTQTVGSDEYAIAFHDDGSLISPTKPAKAGETVSILGTGFGPVKGNILDGYFPPDPAPVLIDAVTITAGTQTPKTDWVGAAPGYTGLNMAKFVVPAGSPSKLPITVTINGVKSNTVTLAVQ